MGGLLIAQALPLMLLMFVLFPRVPGPLWGLPSDAGAARSGLSDRMAPGDIAALILSDGTHEIRFIDPKTFQVTRTIAVFREGQPLRNLNELEFVTAVTSVLRLEGTEQ